MTDEKPKKKAWGSGRIVLIARLQTIKSEMRQGIPLTTIHARHQAALGIGYPSFCKLVTRYANDAKLVSTYPGFRDAGPRTKRAPALPPAPSPLPPAAKTPPYARYEPDTRPTFVHDGRTKEGEAEKLFGPGYLPGSRK